MKAERRWHLIAAQVVPLAVALGLSACSRGAAQNTSCADGWCLEDPLPQHINLTSVWGSGPDEVWAVGWDSQPYREIIAHWDGTAWTTTSSGAPRVRSGVWGTGPDDVWAVGMGSIQRWNGRAWSTALSDAVAHDAVWGSGPDDVWVVGGNAMLHWNGAAWTTYLAPGGQTGLFAVWGSGPDDVWAAGGAYYTFKDPTRLILHWDGVSWKTALSGTSGNLSAVSALWGGGPNDVWAVGTYTFLHWDGSAWSPVSLPRTPWLPPGESTSELSFTSVWGAAPDDVWAVALGGTGVFHWDGRAWSAFGSDFLTSVGLYGVWGSGGDDVWAVGEKGVVLRHRQ